MIVFRRVFELAVGVLHPSIRARECGDGLKGSHSRVLYCLCVEPGNAFRRTNGIIVGTRTFHRTREMTPSLFILFLEPSGGTSIKKSPYHSAHFRNVRWIAIRPRSWHPRQEENALPAEKKQTASRSSHPPCQERQGLCGKVGLVRCSIWLYPSDSACTGAESVTMALIGAPASIKENVKTETARTPSTNQIMRARAGPIAPSPKIERTRPGGWEAKDSI